MKNVYYVGSGELTFELIERIINENLKLELAPEAKERIQKCRDYLDKKTVESAEPLYGISIVAAGALRGTGDTFVPSLMNLGSIWIVRIGLATLLVGPLGLQGVWIAMATELCVRGLLMLYRHKTTPYYKKTPTAGPL